MYRHICKYDLIQSYRVDSPFVSTFNVLRVKQLSMIFLHTRKKDTNLIVIQACAFRQYRKKCVNSGIILFRVKVKRETCQVFSPFLFIS